MNFLSPEQKTTLITRDLFKLIKTYFPDGLYGKSCLTARLKEGAFEMRIFTSRECVEGATLWLQRPGEPHPCKTFDVEVQGFVEAFDGRGTDAAGIPVAPMQAPLVDALSAMFMALECHRLGRLVSNVRA